MLSGRVAFVAAVVALSCSARPADAAGETGNLLARNGLTARGLATPEFRKWFAVDPTGRDMFLHYLVQCSLPPRESLAFEHDGKKYEWRGALGLALEWAGGKPIPLLEQQLVSACLAAHANKYGVKVPILVLARRPDGRVLSGSVERFPLREGCFFGNIFQRQGSFSGNDRPSLPGEGERSSRACALPDPGGKASSNCPPIVYAGNCRDICTPDATGLFYESCRYDGIDYRPVTTRIKADR